MTRIQKIGCSALRAVFLVLAFNAASTTARLNQLANMIECSAKKPWIEYVGYGCWCGPGGHGPALDEVDSCCRAHDHCYARVMTGKDCTYPIEVYLDKYRVTGCAQCDPNQSRCHLDICECDATIAKCLKGKDLNRDINELKYKCTERPRRKPNSNNDYTDSDYDSIDYNSLT